MRGGECPILWSLHVRVHVNKQIFSTHVFVFFSPGISLFDQVTDDNKLH